MRAFRRLLCVSFVLSSLIAPLRGAVTGTVINIDGKAVTGARVSLFAPELIEAQGPRMLADEPQRKPLATMATDSGGKFTFDVPKDQTVVDVRVDAAGYAPAGIRLNAADDDAGAMMLAQAPSLRGTITANGKPVANATVIILGGGEYMTRTDADGHYTAPDPSKWAFRVIVLHPDFAMVEELLGPAGTKKGLDFSLSAGVAIKGRVVAEDGQTPVAEAQLSLDGWPAGKSAADGTFTIAHAPKDWETLQARKDTRVAQRARTAAVAVLKLGKSATVSGNVRDVKSQLPVTGARVSLGPTGRFGARDASVDAISDTKGNFTITGVAAGTYEIRPTRPGYAISGMQAVHLKAADAAQKTLYATARGRISGSVIDEDKRPVAAAHLTTRRAARNNDVIAMMARPGGNGSEGYSAPDGHFVLRNVEIESDLQVDAVKRGYPVAKSPTLKLAAAERKSGLTITIPRGVAITGKVTDKDKKPLSGVGVEAIESSADAGMGMRRFVMSSLQGNRNDELVRTGTDGTFLIRVKEGTYDLAFKREGYSAKSVRGTKVDANTKPVEVMLAPGVEISGRVTRAGAGVEGVSVRSISQDGMSSAVTGSDGSFTISDLTPGPMMLNANKPDSFIQEMRQVTAPARDVLIDLPPGGRITGHVLDKNSHQPVTSFQAGVTTSRGGGGMVVMMPPMQKQFTSDDGSFVLEGIKPGTTQVVVNAPGYTTARVPNIEVEDGKTAPDVEVDVESGSKLTGHVTDASGTPLSGVAVSSNPMAGGGGRAMRFDATDSSATTDPSGEYSFDSLEAGEKTFSFSRSGFVAQQQTVTITSGKDARLDVQLSSGMRATGFVVTDGGAPVPDATVHAASAAEMDGGRDARTDASGGFAFDGLAPGHYTFTAGKTGFAPGTLRDIDIVSSGPVRVILTAGGVITGHVNGLTATELEQATVTASVTGGGGGGGFGGGGGGGSASVAVDAGGNFRIDGAPSGTIHVSARTGAMFGGSIKTAPPKTVELEAGGTAQVDIDFKSSTVISGRVTRNGVPIARALVSFVPRSGQQTTVSGPADADGHYELSGMDDGAYTVQATDMASLSPFTTQYTVHGSDTFDITMKTVTLHGHVIDAGDSHPLNEANVQLQSAGQSFMGSRNAQTDSAGNFTIDNVPSGTYQITADKTGYGHDARTITISDSAPDDVQFQLSPGDGITIRAVDTRDNTALTVNVLRVVDSQGNEVPPQQGFFGGSNAIVTLALSPGVYRVTVTARNYAPQTISMPSPSQQMVRFSPGGTLVLHSRDSSPRSYRLIDSSGVPYAMNPMSQGIFPLPPGATTLNNVAPGHYQLQIIDKSSGNVTNTVQIDVLDGQQSDVSV